MTTETAPDVELTPSDTDYLDTTVCRQCGGPVQRRRPSTTGAHFCAKEECVKAKGRFYHRRRRENASASEAQLAAKLADLREQELANFVGVVARADWHECTICGRDAVVPGYTHPTPDWTAACNPPDRLPLPPGSTLVAKIMAAVYPA